MSLAKLRRLGGAAAIVIAAALLGLMFVLLFAQILLRPFGILFVFAEELAVFLFVWFVFFGIAVAHAQREHLAVTLGKDFVLARLGERGERAWARGLIGVEILFLCVLAIGLFLMIGQSWNMFAGSIPGFRHGYLYVGVLAATLLSLCFLSSDLRHGVHRPEADANSGDV